MGGATDLKTVDLDLPSYSYSSHSPSIQGRVINFANVNAPLGI